VAATKGDACASCTLPIESTHMHSLWTSRLWLRSGQEAIRAVSDGLLSLSATLACPHDDFRATALARAVQVPPVHRDRRVLCARPFPLPLCPPPRPNHHDYQAQPQLTESPILATQPPQAQPQLTESPILATQPPQALYSSKFSVLLLQAFLRQHVRDDLHPAACRRGQRQQPV
jgi:hypothetical protein